MCVCVCVAIHVCLNSSPSRRAIRKRWDKKDMVIRWSGSQASRLSNNNNNVESNKDSSFDFRLIWTSHSSYWSFPSSFIAFCWWQEDGTIEQRRHPPPPWYPVLIIVPSRPVHKMIGRHSEVLIYDPFTAELCLDRHSSSIEIQHLRKSDPIFVAQDVWRGAALPSCLWALLSGVIVGPEGPSSSLWASCWHSGWACSPPRSPTCVSLRSLLGPISSPVELVVFLSVTTESVSSKCVWNC